MTLWSTCIFLIFSFLQIEAAELNPDFYILSVVNELPMGTRNEVLFKDYYVNAGLKNGLKKGAFIDAFRKMSSSDNLNGKFIGDTFIKVGRLQIIHIDENLSIARLIHLYSKKNHPIPGHDGILTGDLIQVSDHQNQSADQ